MYYTIRYMLSISLCPTKSLVYRLGDAIGVIFGILIQIETGTQYEVASRSELKSILGI